MIITVDNKITIEDAPRHFGSYLQNRLTFANPKWLENKKAGRWNGETSQYLHCYEEYATGDLVIPRGFARQLVNAAKKQNVRFQIVDNRRTLPEVSFQFSGSLRPYQQQAVDALLSRDFGTLRAPTGSGKTVMSLSVIAQRRQPTLIVVHTKELLLQWRERIERFLNIPRNEIGLVGDGQRQLGDRVTVGLVQSLYKCADEVAPAIGYLVVDECHRAPSRTFTKAVSAFGCRYMTGLSATPWRRDGLSRLIFWHLGDVVHEIKGEELRGTGALVGVEVITRETEFTTSLNPSEEYSQMLSELTRDKERNLLIASDVIRAAKNGTGICLVLSDRKQHCEELHRLISRHGIDAEVLTGDHGKRKRQAVVERLQSGSARVLCATGQLIGEGFDLKELAALFLATPIKFDGRVIQCLGRVIRPAPGKDRAIVFDYVDSIGVLIAAAKVRQRVYDGLAA